MLRMGTGEGGSEHIGEDAHGIEVDHRFGLHKYTMPDTTPSRSYALQVERDPHERNARLRNI